MRITLEVHSCCTQSYWGSIEQSGLAFAFVAKIILPGDSKMSNNKNEYLHIHHHSSQPRIKLFVLAQPNQSAI